MVFRRVTKPMHARQMNKPRAHAPHGHSRAPRTAVRTAPSATQKSKDTLRVIVLGGLQEIGRNMSLLEYGDDIIIIDMGLQFPEEDQHGVDYIIPNISYLKGKEKNIRGVIITHAHYDHIGAIPHLMPRLGNPVMYTGKLSAGIIQKRHEEYKNIPKLKIVTIDENSKLKLGVFDIEFIGVNHNIPDSYGVVVGTPVGTVVHTGDFKIDYAPLNDKPANLNRIAQIGGRGVRLLMSDSTNAEQPGHQISETTVSYELETVFERAEGRIVVGTFASNLNRIQQIIQHAEKFGRKVILEGRSIQNNVEIAHQLGFVKIKPGTLIESEEYAHKMKQLTDDKIVIIGSGAQGERNAFLMKFANDEHRSLYIKKGDTIIFSSSVIPGNERTVQALKDTLYRRGAKVIHYKMMDVHAGGHAKQEDLKLTIRLLNPEYLMPIEANHYMLQIHKEIGMAVGLPEEKIFVADNGQVVEMAKEGGRLTDEYVPSDYVFVDGLGVGDVSDVVLRDRQMMAEDGMVVVISTIDGKSGQLLGNPDVLSRGFVYMKENREIIEAIRHRVKKICVDHDKKTPAFDEHIKNKIREDLGQYLFSQTKRRPMILPVVIKV